MDPISFPAQLSCTRFSLLSATSNLCIFPHAFHNLQLNFSVQRGLTSFFCQQKSQQDLAFCMLSLWEEKLPRCSTLIAHDVLPTYSDEMKVSYQISISLSRENRSTQVSFLMQLFCFGNLYSPTNAVCLDLSSWIVLEKINIAFNHYQLF